MPRQPKTDRMKDAQEAWLDREIRTMKRDLATLRELEPGIHFPNLWQHAETPEELFKHIQEVLAGTDHARFLHAAKHLGELDHAIKLAVKNRTELLESARIMEGLANAGT